MMCPQTIGNQKIAVFDSPIDSLQVAKYIALHKNSKGRDGAFYVVDVGKIVERFAEWKRCLPRVEVFYAVKCNDDPVLLEVLAGLGCGFDISSKTEMDMTLNLVQPEKIIYANPCKTRSFIRRASEMGVCLMTFDSEEEIRKIAHFHPKAEMILRIAIADQTAHCQLSLKFGCEPEGEATRLLETAAELGVSVVGISFHISSGCNNPTALRTAIQWARRLFDTGKELGHHMNILDIGGGYPGSETASHTFQNMLDVIVPCVDEYFPIESEVRIIAEPGRHFACSPFSLVTSITNSVKVPASRITNDSAEGDGYMYYMNDGVFGSFNCIFFECISPKGKPLFEPENGELYPCTIWGPTYDSLDQIEKCTYLPRLKVGDWLLYEDMGAYTCAAASGFSGFAPPKRYYFVGKKAWMSAFNQAEESLLVPSTVTTELQPFDGAPKPEENHVTA